MNTIIPNELNITINTSVPGFQKINYKPSMNIKNVNKDDRKIQFDPLIKLNPATIKKVPEDLRQKEFVNKGLFQSLLNYHNGAHKAKTLKEATFTGIVDNNIKVTLDTLFPTNSVIYINKSPYVIVDIQWRKGDWKIDTKQKPVELDSSKIDNPYLYSSVVQDEIISGDRQLQQIPEDLTYGENYVGPKNTVTPAPSTETVVDTPIATPIATPTASGVNQPQPTPTPTPTPTPIPTPIPTPEQTPEQTPENKIVPYTPSKPTSITTESQTDIEPYVKPEPLAITDTDSNNIPPLAIEDSNIGPINDDIEEIDDDEISNDNIVPETKLTPSKISSKFLRDFFNSVSYYYMVNSLYKFMNNNTRNYINNIYLHTTTINVKINTTNLSKDAYKETINNMSVKKNAGGGDCFFIAVSDAINYYNYLNQNDKIISGIYGSGTKIFTQLYLRSLVADYILSSPNLDTYLQNAIVNVEDLNEKFENHLKTIEQLTKEEGNGEISGNDYVSIAENIYKNFDNFFVKKPNGVPFDINDYYKPFKVIEKSEIKDYIESSDYWANEVGIYALCSSLKLNVIPIERVDSSDGSRLRIPFANFSKSDNKWNKYLFLYYYSSHYELITFKYYEKKIKKTGKTIIGFKNLPQTAVIFDKRNNDIIPPIYILFLIYGSYYSRQKDEYKDNFSFFPVFMKIIENSYKNMIDTQYDGNIDSINKFNDYFNTNFPGNNINKLLPIQIENSPQEGGRNPYSNPYNNPYSNPYNNPYSNPYNNPYSNPYSKPAYKMVKKTEDNKSNVGYYITIDMELHPGLTLTPEELKESQCRQKWNAVRKAYAGFRGQPYIIPPVYQTNKTSKNKEDQSRNKTKAQKGGLRKNRKTKKNLYVLERKKKTLKNKEEP